MREACDWAQVPQEAGRRHWIWGTAWALLGTELQTSGRVDGAVTSEPSLLTPSRHFICRMSLQKFSIFLVISHHATSSADRSRHWIAEVTVRSSHFDFLVLLLLLFIGFWNSASLAQAGIELETWRRRSLELLTFHLQSPKRWDYSPDFPCLFIYSFRSLWFVFIYFRLWVLAQDIIHFIAQIVPLLAIENLFHLAPKSC